MVIGNPYVFAFMIDKVSEWSDATFKNGVFFVAINGVIFPHVLATTVLNSELYGFLEARPSSLLKMPINDMLFHMQKDVLFSTLLNALSQDDEMEGFDVLDYKFSTNTMEDEACYCFSVSNGKMLRILGAKIDVSLDYSQKENCNSLCVSEVEVDVEYMKEQIEMLKKYYHKEII